MEKGMNPAELERIHAEISKMIAETARISDERRKMDAEITKMGAETLKLYNEAAKMERERWWYPVFIAGTIMGATAAIVKIFFT